MYKFYAKEYKSYLDFISLGSGSRTAYLSENVIFAMLLKPARIVLGRNLVILLDLYLLNFGFLNNKMILWVL